MIFKNTDELFNYLINYYKQNGGKVRISTYGMYVGITNGKDWNDVYPSIIREFIDIVDNEDLKILVGKPYKIECKPNCPECEAKYKNTLKRFEDTKEMLDINMRVNDALHLKMYNIGDLYISGGLNMSQSNFIDASFIIMDSQQKEFLNDIFEKAWVESM